MDVADARQRGQRHGRRLAEADAPSRPGQPFHHHGARQDRRGLDLAVRAGTGEAVRDAVPRHGKKLPREGGHIVRVQAARFRRQQAAGHGRGRPRRPRGGLGLRARRALPDGGVDDDHAACAVGRLERRQRLPRGGARRPAAALGRTGRSGLRDFFHDRAGVARDRRRLQLFVRLGVEVESVRLGHRHLVADPDHHEQQHRVCQHVFDEDLAGRPLFAPYAHLARHEAPPESAHHLVRAPRLLRRALLVFRVPRDEHVRLRHRRGVRGRRVVPRPRPAGGGPHVAGPSGVVGRRVPVDDHAVLVDHRRAGLVRRHDAVEGRGCVLRVHVRALHFLHGVRRTERRGRRIRRRDGPDHGWRQGVCGEV
mmetsp:Transcript_76559/g.234367  ORF Transcript_76559/g.234367 Transcript_76559/m.234367 type:complete len:366 (-) Transcript_76559:490-1587(-)